MIQLSRADLEVRGWSFSDPPPVRTRTWRDRRTWREAERTGPGTFRLKRRYLKRFTVSESPIGGLAVFQWTKDGWRAATVFPPEDVDRYLERQRGGVLAYRRKE